MRLSPFLCRLLVRSSAATHRTNRNIDQRRPLDVRSLEDRVVPAGGWTNLAASGSAPPNGGAAMMLLSDGTVLIQDGKNVSGAGGQSADMFELSPQALTGSYVNGSWIDVNNMNEARLFFTTAMLSNGKVFAVGGEYPSFSNTAEIFDPLANAGLGSWTYVDSAPTADSKFGDDPIEVLSTGPNAGQILAGYYNSGTTYRFNPSAAAGSQWVQTAGSKLHNEFGGRTDRSDEESWVKLKDGSVLSYDVWSSGASNTFQAQRYDPTTDTWVDASTLSATNPPSILESNGGQGRELGPAFLQPDGKVIYFGANGNTAIYDPNDGPNGTWSAGFPEPQKNLTLTRTGPVGQPSWGVSSGSPSDVATNLVGTDNPGAMLPNGRILIALSPQGPMNSAADGGGYSFPNATYIYEYDPTATTAAAAWTEITPGGLSSTNAFTTNMVVLPTGQVLFSTEGATFQIYSEDPATGPQDAWRPTISSIVDNGDSTFTLKGTQLNGISEGANYGDDNMSASNYPIIRFTQEVVILGTTFSFDSYARTFNWSSNGVTTGSTPITTQFTLPAGHSSLSDFTSVTVIANGIPSTPFASSASPNVIAPSDQTAVEGASTSFGLGSFIDPDDGPWSVDVNWGDSTADTTFAAGTQGSLGSRNHTYTEEGSYTVTVTVTDSTSLSGSASFHVAVSDPAVIPTGGFVVNAVEGADSGSQTVATFTDPGGPEPVGDYSAVIDWGDGTAPSAGTITFGAGIFTVSGNHTYAEESAADHPGSNPYIVNVTISHEAAPDASASSTAVVSDPAVIAIGGFQFIAVEGDPSAVQTVATFTDPGGAEPLGDYSALVDWGDGTAPSPGTITFSAGVFTVTGSHSYAVGLGVPGDFGNTFCDVDPPSYHKPITVTISHENALDAVAVSDAKISLKPGSAHLASDGSLIVVGTTADDKIQFTPVGNQSRRVTVKLGSTNLGSFTVGGGGRIVVAAMGGDDDIQVAGGIRVDTVLYGGPGDDRIKGGGGLNIEVGCEGEDTLTGGNGGDLLVGGAGADRLIGGNGADIIIAGTLVDSSNNEDDNYDDLVSVLEAGMIPSPLSAADDGAVDKITGGGGSDTFYYNFAGGGVLDILTGGWDRRFDI